jgi:hypothetical protein
MEEEEEEEEELLRVWIVCAVVGCFVASECPVNR